MDLVNLMNTLSVNDKEDYSASNLRAIGAHLDGVHTDIVYGDFTNKSLIVASQYEKVGALLKVTIDQPETNLDISAPVYTVNVLFGGENIEHLAAARFIAEKLSITKPLMLFLSLKAYEVTTLNSVIELVIKLANKTI